VVVGMEEIERHPTDQLGGFACPEETRAGGVRKHHATAAVEEDGIRRNLDQVPV
jgi:hypothetical protein